MSRVILKGDRFPYWIALTIDWVLFTTTFGLCQAKCVQRLQHYIARRNTRRRYWRDDWQ